MLQEVDLRPDRIKYWENPKIDDKAAFESRVREICELYQSAPEMLAAGKHVVCVDEKTGIPANSPQAIFGLTRRLSAFIRTNPPQQEEPPCLSLSIGVTARKSSFRFSKLAAEESCTHMSARPEPRSTSPRER
jgi:hypothetical protein